MEARAGHQRSLPAHHHRRPGPNREGHDPVRFPTALPLPLTCDCTEVSIPPSHSLSHSKSRFAALHSSSRTFLCHWLMWVVVTGPRALTSQYHRRSWQCWRSQPLCPTCASASATWSLATAKPVLPPCHSHPSAHPATQFSTWHPNLSWDSSNTI